MTYSRPLLMYIRSPLSKKDLKAAKSKQSQGPSRGQRLPLTLTGNCLSPLLSLGPDSFLVGGSGLRAQTSALSSEPHTVCPAACLYLGCVMGTQTITPVKLYSPNLLLQSLLCG